MGKPSLRKIESTSETKSRRSVLFLHGFPGYVTRNEDIAVAVAKNCKCDVYILDFDGLDESPILFSFLDSVSAVGKSIDYMLSKYDQLNVVAHSFGAYALFSSPEVPFGRLNKIIALSPLVELPGPDVARIIVSDFVAEEAATKKKQYNAGKLLTELETLRKSSFIQKIPGLIERGNIHLNLIQAKSDNVTPVEILEAWLQRNGLEKKLEIDFIDDDHWFSNRARIIDLVVSKVV